MRRTVLFVCTGNYYRSRYAALLFEDRAARAGIAWRAASAGLRLFPRENVGPISPLVAHALRARGVRPPRRNRLPVRLTDAQLGAAARIVVLDGRQHRERFLTRHAAHAARVEWWDVPDLHEMAADQALGRAADRVEDLVARLAGPRRARGARRVPPPVRDAVRVLLLDPDDRVLLLRYRALDGGGDVWAPPGGGLETTEDHLRAAWRELAEEVTDRAEGIEIGPWIWVREHDLALAAGAVRQRERWYLARANRPTSVDPARTARLSDEGVHELRWWRTPELRAEAPRTAPRRLAGLLTELLAGRIPDRPIDIGV